MVTCDQRAAVETRCWTCGKSAASDSPVRPDSRACLGRSAIGSRPRIAGGLVRQRRNLSTILNRHRLIRWAARILQAIRDNCAPAPAAREAGVAHGSGVPRWASRPNVGQTPNQPCGRGLPASGSPQESVPFPASVQLAVWRQVMGLHNKERARDHNPLTSANPLSHHEARRSAREARQCQARAAPSADFRPRL